MITVAGPGRVIIAGDTAVGTVPSRARTATLLITTITIFVLGRVATTVIALLTIVIGIVSILHGNRIVLAGCLTGVGVLTGTCLDGTHHACK